MNETTNVDLILRLGKISDGVTVNDVVHIVETDRSSISGRVDERRVRTLPLNGENFARLVLLAPGIAGGSPNNPSVSGSRPVANSYGIDGVSANDERGSNGLSLGGGGAAEFSAFSPNLISTEAVQEFSITTSGADAAFGRGSGGQINIVTKSGGNARHGSAYEYFRNNKLDARDFFNNGPFFAKGTPRRSVVPPFKQNLFGATLGGPVRKDRDFFFASYEGFRQKLEQTSSATVPNADLIRQIPGEMGRLFRIFYIDRGIVPAAGNPAGTFSALPTGDRAAATGGGFPATLFNGNASDGEAGTVLLSTANTREVRQDAFLIRTDHKLTRSLDMNLRYAFAQPLATTNQRAIAGVFSESRRRWQSGVAQFVYIPKASQILEVRAGLLRFPFPKGGQIPLNTGLPPQGRFVDPGLRTPMTYRYSGALEQRISADTSVTVSYVGLRATGLFRWEEPNGLGSVPHAARPDSRFARYRYTNNTGDSAYNAFQTYARHRFAKGIDFTVSYSYGNSVDTYSQDVGDNSQRNPAPGLAQFSSLINLAGSPAAGFQGSATSWVARPVLAERGNSDFDVRHNLALSHVLELPVGKGRRHFLRNCSADIPFPASCLCAPASPSTFHREPITVMLALPPVPGPPSSRAA